jgi:hypothetical protein
VTPGYQQVRYIVTIASGAPEADVMRVIEAADAHSTFHDVFTREQHVVREVKIVTPDRAEV